MVKISIWWTVFEQRTVCVCMLEHPVLLVDTILRAGTVKLFPLYWCNCLNLKMTGNFGKKMSFPIEERPTLNPIPNGRSPIPKRHGSIKTLMKVFRGSRGFSNFNNAVDLGSVGLFFSITRVYHLFHIMKKTQWLKAVTILHDIQIRRCQG